MNTYQTTIDGRPLQATASQVDQSWDMTKRILAKYRARIRRHVEERDEFGYVKKRAATELEHRARAAAIYINVLGELPRDGLPVEWMLKRISLRVQLNTLREIIEADLVAAHRAELAQVPRRGLRVVDGDAVCAEVPV